MTLGSHQQSVGRSQVHITPRWLVDRLAPFDLDPAAADPRPWACAVTNWSTHGLERDWFGLVYLNPPFDRYEVGSWIAKLAAHGNGIRTGRWGNIPKKHIHLRGAAPQKLLPQNNSRHERRPLIR